MSDGDRQKTLHTDHLTIDGVTYRWVETEMRNGYMSVAILTDASGENEFEMPTTDVEDLLRDQLPKRIRAARYLDEKCGIES